MELALARHQTGEARVFPSFVRKVGQAVWQQSSFAKLQPLPQDGNVKLWEDLDAAWSQVADGLEKVIKEVRST